MDTATSRSMTGVGRARAYASPLPSPVPSSSLPPRPPPAILEVPSAHTLRHSARSRRIHLRLPTHPLEKPGSFALHYGYCDFAQYDGRWQGKGVRVAAPRRAPSPPVPAPPRRPPRPRAPSPPAPAIPEVVAKPKLPPCNPRITQTSSCIIRHFQTAISLAKCSKARGICGFYGCLCD